jgi:predicted TIM-barrel fold metal-dependent hydrolase
VDRSAFLGVLAAAPLVGAAPAPFRVDVHHHCVPPFLADAVSPQKIFPLLDGWTPERSFRAMDDGGIATAVLSMPRSPIAYFGPYAASRVLARRVNEYMAGLRRSYPNRFRFWADVPLPDVDGSLREAVYALDVLGADGIGVATSYGTAWLGEAAFAPLWEELNRRRAVVFVHPLANACCVNQVPGVADTTIEYGTETTRTIASVVFSGTAARYANLRFIYSHAGGTMPFLIDRFRFQARDPKLAAAIPNGIDHELKKFYYETAQAATPGTMSALSKLVPTSQILFGTDVPYRRAEENVAGLATCSFRPSELQSIYSTNALALLARQA